MAPKPINTSELGLHQSEIAEPPPLRIIKRSKTVSGSSASGDSLCGRRGGSSDSSLYSKGSPPLPADRPLTVHKLRKGRASILGSSMDSSGDMSLGTYVFDTPRKADFREDKDLTPKAQTLDRISSAGSFLKSEYHGGKETHNDGYYSLRGSHDVKLFDGQTFTEYPDKPPSSKNTSPTIPERRFSKSKNFLLRAMGGGTGGISHPIRRSNSTTSRNTLVRRISRKRQPSVESYGSSYAGSTASENTCYFEPTSVDLSDTCDATFESTYSQPLSSSSSDSMVESPPRDIFVLYPHIMVTPEVPSLDAGLSIIWVAIQVTGVLQIAEGNPNRSPEVKQFPVDSTNPNLSDLASYGKLHSMRIDLHPGQGCTVLEIIGNLHESKTIRAGETQLVLAKIRVAKVKVPRAGSEGSTDGMIADLQNHLGDTISSYLTVRLTYKHSAFPNHKPLEPLDGMKLRLSRIETEATATIKRRNSESAWSPRTSQTMNNPLEVGPVVRLVENHFSPGRADEVRKRLVHNRSPISIAHKFGYSADDYGFDATDSKFRNHSMGLGIESVSDQPLRASKSRLSLRKSIFTQQPLLPPPSLEEDLQPQFDDMDPARRIWSEMRLTSRGGRNRHSRASLGANHYFSMRNEKTPSPRANSDRNNQPGTSFPGSKGNPIPNGDVGDERDRIMQAALRNKRSVGAETLRSIAPSVSGSRGDTRSKGGSATGLGLGAGRAWGWTAPWW